jgi:hypothetical protein
MERIVAPIWYIQQAIEAYKKCSRLIEKSSEEKKDEEIKIKPVLQTGCGGKIDIYA